MRFLSYYPRALVGDGGPTVAMWAWVRALKEAGAHVEVLYDEALKSEQPLAVKNVPCYPVKHRLWGRWRYPVNIQDYIDGSTVLLLHSAYLYSNLKAAREVMKKNAKFIFTPHGAYEHNARKRNKLMKNIWLSLERYYLKKAFAIHVFVETEISSVREVAPTTPVISLPTPIEVPEKQKWYGGGGYIAWVGRYDIEHKGLDLLVEAYRLVPKEKRIPIIMRGRDSKNTRTEVKKLVELNGLQNEISVGGPIEGAEKIDFLCHADFYVMPSRWESFSIALLEAMALGVPCVVSDRMPIAQRLKEERAALVTPVTPKELAKTIADVIERMKSLKDILSPRDFVEKYLSFRSIGISFVTQVTSLVNQK